MSDRTSSNHHSSWNYQAAGAVILSLLMAAGTYAGRQTPPAASTRRISAASQLKLVQLPDPSTGSVVTVEQALVALGKLEPPSNQRLDLTKISQLAWALQKVTLPAPGPLAPAAPVPSEVTAMKAYFVLPDGLYAYNPLDHTLQQVGNEDLRGALAAGLMNQSGAPTGGCQIILTGSAQEFGRRYGPRARTVMELQAGQMSRSLQLEAVAQGLTFISIDAVEATAVRKVIRTLRTQEPLYVALVGTPASQAPTLPTDAAQTTQGAVLLVVPPQNFQDAELTMTRRGLEQAGAQVLVASTRRGVLNGMLGQTDRADLLLNEANLDNFNAVVFIGGTGTTEYLNNPIVLNLARQAAAKRKVLAASGTAPSILAGAGVLKGARATAFLSEQARLVQGGAIYSGAPVEKDSLTITSTGPQVVPVFVRAIVDALGEARSSTAPVPTPTTTPSPTR